MHVVYGLDDMACRMQASRFLCLQVPTERFVLEVVDKHTASAAEFVHRFQAPCACVGPGSESAPDWWLVLSLTQSFQEQQSVVIAGTLIPSMINANGFARC